MQHATELLRTTSRNGLLASWKHPTKHNAAKAKPSSQNTSRDLKNEAVKAAWKIRSKMYHIVLDPFSTGGIQNSENEHNLHNVLWICNQELCAKIRNMKIQSKTASV
jgi:hypothetical protein